MKRKKVVVLALIISLIGSSLADVFAYADEGDLSEEIVYDTFLSVSPTREGIVVNPGETYKGSYKVSNPGYGINDITYRTVIKPFFVNDNHEPVYDNVDGRSEMVNWIKILKNGTGTLKPNDVTIVEYEINVPEDAPAGGQYASISTVVELSSGEGSDESSGGINIKESMGISHVVLAEITGKSESSGKILDLGIQGFVLDGLIGAYSTVENTGDIHGLAKYTMKIYPLFSDQVIYSNEENLEDHYVLPGKQFTNETYWEGTPMVGIYNVYYAVEFMGNKSEVTRMVIVCPWWLLMLFGIGLLLLILRIVTLVKLRKKRDVLVVD